MRKANEWMATAFRPATQRSHIYVIRLFVGLALKLSMDYLRPGRRLAMAFLVFLEHNYRTYKCVSNMLGTLVACLKRAHIDISAFELPETHTLLRSMSINKRTSPDQRPPVSAETLRRIVIYLRSHQPAGDRLAAAVLIMFVTGLRQSNLLPATQKSFDSTRQLTWRDISWRPDHIKLCIKWGKSQQQMSNRYVRIPRASDPELCTVTSLINIYSAACDPDTPVVAFKDMRPIPLRYLTKRWKEAMQTLGLAPHRFTLHSLRRGGARFLQNSGLKTESIAGHVGWRSRAIYEYISQPSTKMAYNALKHL